MDDLAVTETLVMRFADVGIATYASLRVVGAPERSVTWVLEEPHLDAIASALAPSLPDPVGTESPAQAIERAMTTGGFASTKAELELARLLGSHLIGIDGWQLLADCVAAPRPVLFITPSPRLGRVPWGQLAMQGRDGFRVMELADVLMAVPPNIVHAPRRHSSWQDRADRPSVLLLDPRIPGQRPDSALGSVLGRPSAETTLSRHFGGLVAEGAVLPTVTEPVELFRRTETDRRWLADACAQDPSRLVYVGHASAADGDAGYADRAALHLAEERPLTAGEMIAAQLPIPPRVALLACASGGDYRFDEAAGLVAAMILGGAQLVTATLWSLPTTAGFRQFGGAPAADPMADTIVGVDLAHREDEAGLAVNRWQRATMRRWRDGDTTASPLYWAAMATFTVDGAR
ncbi:CHAT domain-containing protein [Mycolicibacterium sp. (ex Dasyatis americana)]|uniref:CHAT domain-containing protein n=1 Tax=Mycobacterium syngnathidarum TaxID=1908205 RepID=A0A1Q9W920_9MYCO|nr:MULTISPECIES: CHAT domain-containing protein [Mycobacterium]MCG7611205.1 CHAT domain-containing protein [Mycobacterium sp. CnD-18-1]OFB38379.1 CHAT domain-containing protein [Mycolicibacterium sp. (ex Dasyatis americana)]OHT90893.1 CHAT domain-containing protein [Mycobacterium syngnathidarum]OLT95202.1 CHAT domain-containing protein [Mycobacterium syngnathidarum]